MMSDADVALTYAYQKSDKAGSARHTWSLVGPDGGVHIWAQENSEDIALRFGDRYFGGIECHWPAGVDEVHHAECWLLKGPCRHDGSSLYFSERIGPMLSPDNIEGENIASYMQSELHDWYHSKIAGARHD